MNGQTNWSVSFLSSSAHLNVAMKLPHPVFKPHHHYLAVFLNNEVPADFNDRTDYDLWSGKPVLERDLRFLSWRVSSEM